MSIDVNFDYLALQKSYCFDFLCILHSLELDSSSLYPQEPLLSFIGEVGHYAELLLDRGRTDYLYTLSTYHTVHCIRNIQVNIC